MNFSQKKKSKEKKTTTHTHTTKTTILRLGQLVRNEVWGWARTGGSAPVPRGSTH